MLNGFRKMFGLTKSVGSQAIAYTSPVLVTLADDDYPGFFTQEELEDFDLEANASGIAFIDIEVIERKTRKRQQRQNVSDGGIHCKFDPFHDIQDAIMYDASSIACGERGFFGTH